MVKCKVMVTGSGGFIFSNFMRLAQREESEYEFVSLDKVAQAKNLKNIYEHRKQKFHFADVSDRHIMERIFQVEQPDIVIHGAAESHVDDSIADTDPFIISNVLGTQIVTDMCVKYSVKRLIFISTDEVYGQLKDERAEAWSEDACMAPRNPYSSTKAAGELIVLAAHETHGLNYNITRACNNFGPRQQLKNLVPKVIRCIVNEESIPVYGQGAQMREWIHVSDNCKAILAIMKGPANEAYNISAGYEISNIELVHHLCNSLEGGHNLITFVKDRAGHDFRYAIDSSKLRELGWSPSLKFKDGLKDTCDWYLRNRWFLR